MNVCLYGRVSTSRQDNENQLAQLRQFAASQGWTIVREYTDEVTGSSSDRPAFRQMFDAASRREFDSVLFWALDRLSREGALETLQHLQRLTSYGVAWRSFTEQYLDSTGIFRDAVIGILAAIAKQERVRLGERTRAGLERIKREGELLGRPAAKVDAARMRDGGASWSEISRRTGLARATRFNGLAAKWRRRLISEDQMIALRTPRN